MNQERRLEAVGAVLREPAFIPLQTEDELTADLVKVILELHDTKPDRFAQMMVEKAETDPLFVAVCYEVVTSR